MSNNTTAGASDITALFTDIESDLRLLIRELEAYFGIQRAFLSTGRLATALGEVAKARRCIEILNAVDVMAGR